ncbi:restriction endonuclease subunit S [Pseudoalteromonas sp. MMG022]|uniref:restriction endonuclease subunit S n=1 Tax=Pseudoalteromonas sp. MMG022 TaxID=2909978 RepID=UPI001F029BB5|nr:restriction endonuclease subunit S [Pseudoalteromonas sp. MMG022]MCF6437190.1 restriction endonuclease subunit S [Pseudoalteromonas sp. MMG022]
MRSNYKKLGQFIQVVDTRNKENRKDNLLGVSTQKVFIDSVANTVGTDFKKYKIVRKHQFTYVPDTSRRGDKMGIAMLESLDQALVSQAYTVFEVKDSNQIDPEYLMMWFRRPEFDRYARFKSHGSVREIFDWQEMCDVELPVPPIEKQREIVREYNVVNNRIALNEQLTQKLEDTAQALYKQWFVDFEFPISKEYAQSIGKPELEGMPYKSSGGEMELCAELEKDIPLSWRYVSIQTLIDSDVLEKNQDGNHGEIHPKSSEFVESGIPFVMANDVNNGVIDLDSCKFITKERAEKLRIGFAKAGDVLITHKATMGRVGIVPEVDDYIMLTPQVTYYRIKDSKQLTKEFLYCLFSEQGFQHRFCSDGEQSTRSYLGITNQRKLQVILPSSDAVSRFSSTVQQLLNYKICIVQESCILRKMLMLLNSRMSKA